MQTEINEHLDGSVTAHELDTTSIKGLSDKDAEEAILAHYLYYYGKECEDSLTAAIFRIRILEKGHQALLETFRGILNRRPGYCLRCGHRYWIDTERSGELQTAFRNHAKECPHRQSTSLDSEKEELLVRIAELEAMLQRTEARPTSIQNLDDKDAEKFIRTYYADYFEKECEDSLTAAIFRVRILEKGHRTFRHTINNILNRKPGYCLRCGRRYWRDAERSGDLQTAFRKHAAECHHKHSTSLNSGKEELLVQIAELEAMLRE